MASGSQCARFWPPDIQQELEHQRLPTPDTHKDCPDVGNRKTSCGISNIFTCCHQAFNSTGKVNFEGEPKATSKQSVFSRCRRKLALSIRDKKMVRAQLSIWFPCIFRGPGLSKICESVREVKPASLQQKCITKFVKMNEHLSESKRQRTQHRKRVCGRGKPGLTLIAPAVEQERRSCDAHLVWKGDKVDVRKNGEMARRQRNLPFPSDSPCIPESLENKALDYADSKTQMFNESSQSACNIDVPEWFFSFLHSGATLNLDLWEDGLCDTVRRRVDVKLMFDFEAEEKTHRFHLLVRELTCDTPCLDMYNHQGMFHAPDQSHTERQSEAAYSRQLSCSAKGRARNVRKSVSDCSLQSMGDASDWRAAVKTFPEEQSFNFKHRHQRDRVRRSRSKCRALARKSQEWRSSQISDVDSKTAAASESLYIGDSSETGGSNVNLTTAGYSLSTDTEIKNSNYNLSNMNPQTAMLKHHQVMSRRICDVTTQPTRRRQEYRSLMRGGPFPLGHLNTSNSSSNGTNRTAQYSRDNFSGAPKTKGSSSNARGSSKGPKHDKKGKPRSKSPKKKLGVPSSGSPDSRRPLYAAYEKKYGDAPSAHTTSSEDDSASWYTVKEKYVHAREVKNWTTSKHANVIKPSKGRADEPGKHCQPSASGESVSSRKSGRRHRADKETREQTLKDATGVCASKSLPQHDETPRGKDGAVCKKSQEPRSPSKADNLCSSTKHNKLNQLKTSAKIESQASPRTLSTEMIESPAVHGEEMCGDFTHAPEKLPAGDENKPYKGQETSDELLKSVLKEPFTQTDSSRAKETLMVMPVQFGNEIGDGPDKRLSSRNGSDLVEAAVMGDMTSNAGGDEEEEEPGNVSTKPSGDLAEKADAEPEAATEETEKKASAAEVSAKPSDPGFTDPNKACMDNIDDCVRKWSKAPPCNIRSPYIPSIPACCTSTCSKPPFLEEAPKEESKAMKCTYTGFTDAKKSDLESLIEKHVSYLRCAQGENAAVSKQTSFLSGGTDQYTKMCKDIAFKSSADLFNQTLSKGRSNCPDMTSCDPCLKLPPLCKPCCPMPCPPLCPPPCPRPCPPCCPPSCPPPLCPRPCPPPCCPDQCGVKLPALCKDPCTGFTRPCLPTSSCTKLPRIPSSSCCPDPCKPCPNPCKPRCPDPCKPYCPDPCKPCPDPCKPYCPDPCKPYCPDPCKPYCPDPCKPYCPDPCKPYCPDPCKPYCPDPCKPYCPDPCKPYCPDPCKPYCPDPCKPYCPDPCKPYCPDPCKPYCPDPCKPYCPDPCKPRCPDPCKPYCPDPCKPRCPDPCKPYCPDSCKPYCSDPCKPYCPDPCKPFCPDPCKPYCPDPCKPRCPDPCKPYCPDPCKPYCPDPCKPYCPDPCLKPCSPSRCCIDPCTKRVTTCSPPPCCVDPCSGKVKPCTPSPSCFVDPCTGKVKACSVKQYRIDPITQLPILCTPLVGSNPCPDPCAKTSCTSCVSCSDTRLCRPACQPLLCPPACPPACPPTCPPPCTRSLSFCQKMMGCESALGVMTRRRSSSLDQFTGTRKSESLNFKRKLECVESKWSGIRQKACEVLEHIAKLQREEACRPKLCPSPCAIPCSSPCTPCLSPCALPCRSPCPLPYRSPCELPCRSPCVLPCPMPCTSPISCKPTPVCCTQTSSCFQASKLTSTGCRSACNQTSEMSRAPASKCSTTCAQLNESSNKKCQVGAKAPCEEISTCVGPSLMCPPPRKKSRGEKKCTIMRIGKCDEGGAGRESGVDTSCCSTQAEGGKIAEIAKFVKECLDDSTSAASNRPIVKIRYSSANKGSNNCASVCQDAQLKEQIAKAIKKGKEIQRQNKEQPGTNPRSRTVLRFKAGKNSPDQCEIYNVQLEDENTKAGSKRKSKTKECPCLSEPVEHTQEESRTVCDETKTQACSPCPCPLPEVGQCQDVAKYANRCHKSNVDVTRVDRATSYAQNEIHDHENDKPETAEQTGAESREINNQVSKSVVRQKSSSVQQEQMYTSNSGSQGWADTSAMANTHPEAQASMNAQEGNSSQYPENTFIGHTIDDTPTVQENIHPLTSQGDLLPLQQEGLGNGTQVLASDTQEEQSTPVQQDTDQIDEDKDTKTPDPNSNENANSEKGSIEKSGSKEFLIDNLIIPSNTSWPSERSNKAAKSTCKRKVTQIANGGQFAEKLKASSSRSAHDGLSDYWSSDHRDLRRRCFYLQDPSWEAYEYIEANRAALPTSYTGRSAGSLARALACETGTRSTSLQRLSSKVARKSPYTRCARQSNKIAVVKSTNTSSNSYSIASNFSGHQSPLSACLSGGELSRQTHRSDSGMGGARVLPAPMKRMPAVSILVHRGDIDTFATSCTADKIFKQSKKQTRELISFSCDKIQGKCLDKKENDIDAFPLLNLRDDVSTLVSAGNECKLISENLISKVKTQGFSSHIKTDNPSSRCEQKHHPLDHKTACFVSCTATNASQHMLHAHERAFLETIVEATMSRTSGSSEGSTHGIEDLPLDSEAPAPIDFRSCSRTTNNITPQLATPLNHAPSRHIYMPAQVTERSEPVAGGHGTISSIHSSIVSEDVVLTPRYKTFQGNGSTVVSEDKTMHPGNYVEVCSSMSFQNKVLAPRHSLTPEPQRVVCSKRDYNKETKLGDCPYTQERKHNVKRFSIRRLIDHELSGRQESKHQQVTIARLLETDRANAVAIAGGIKEHKSCNDHDLQRGCDDHAQGDKELLLSGTLEKFAQCLPLQPQKEGLGSKQAEVGSKRTHTPITVSLPSESLPQTPKECQLLARDKPDLVFPTVNTVMFEMSEQGVADVYGNQSLKTNISKEAYCRETLQEEADDDSPKKAWLEKPKITSGDILCAGSMLHERFNVTQDYSLIANTAPYKVVDNSSNLPYSMESIGKNSTQLYGMGKIKAIHLKYMNSGAQWIGRDTKDASCVEFIECNTGETFSTCVNKDAGSSTSAGATKYLSSIEERVKLILDTQRIKTEKTESQVGTREPNMFMSDILKTAELPRSCDAVREQSKCMQDANTMTHTPMQYTSSASKAKKSLHDAQTMTQPMNISAGKLPPTVVQVMDQSLQISGAGGDAWRTIHVGCAEVTQASPRRVVVEGAYVQHQAHDLLPTLDKSMYQSGTRRLVPFRLVFFKKNVAAGDLDVEGTYSRPDMTSPSGKQQTWGIRV